MDVTNSGTNPIRDLLKTQSVDQSQSTEQSQRVVHRSTGRTSSTPDQAIISDRGVNLARIKDAVRNAPDVRENRVAQLREAVASGTYSVSSAELAKAILASQRG